MSIVSEDPFEELLPRPQMTKLSKFSSSIKVTREELSIQENLPLTSKESATP